MTPAEFYAARLDELEAKARAVGPTRAMRDDLGSWWISTASGERLWRITEADMGTRVAALFDHAMSHQPGLVLADIAAKRAVLARLGPPYWIAGGSSAPFHAVVEALIQPFAEHPDFDESWRI